MSSADPRNAARVIDALRRGWPVKIEGESGHHVLLAIETATDNAIAEAGGAVALLISPSRAATLKLGNQFSAADTSMPTMIAVHTDTDAALALTIADPALDLAFPLKGPFTSLTLSAPEAATAALDMAREAGLLPAFLIVKDEECAAAQATLVDIAAYTASSALFIAARAALPVATATNAQLVAFRSRADATDHVALIIGERDGTAPVVRLHSECLTGDVLGSLKCDCGPQLHKALQDIAKANWGVLLYLRQEGRGIGLVNKLRAYALQDQGFDTVEANLRLGFDIDSRDFAVAAQMLSSLSIDQVRLLTNNPQKVEGLQAAGIFVTERLPLNIAANAFNAHYLATKRDKTGHKI